MNFKNSAYKNEASFLKSTQKTHENTKKKKVHFECMCIWGVYIYKCIKFHKVEIIFHILYV